MMHDMGTKMKDMGAPIETKSPEDNKVRYPTLYLENAPEDMMDKEMGHMCRIEVIAKVVGKRITDGPDGKKQTIDLEIHKLGYKTKAGKVSSDEYKKMSDKDREEYDKEDLNIDEKEEE